MQQDIREGVNGMKTFPDIRMATAKFMNIHRERKPLIIGPSMDTMLWIGLVLLYHVP